jgi:hypothetical protein
MASVWFIVFWWQASSWFCFCSPADALAVFCKLMAVICMCRHGESIIRCASWRDDYIKSCRSWYVALCRRRWFWRRWWWHDDNESSSFSLLSTLLLHKSPNPFLAGSNLLEFHALSRASGNPVFGAKAAQAMRGLWSRRSSLGYSRSVLSQVTNCFDRLIIALQFVRQSHRHCVGRLGSA